MLFNRRDMQRCKSSNRETISRGGRCSSSKHSDHRDPHCENFEECERTLTIDQEEDQSPSRYLDQKVFRLLLPAVEETLVQASKWNALRIQKCRFNGLDYIAELLWNRNPRRSRTYSPMLNVFQIPPFKEYLLLHPRPYYPKSWLWSEEDAALRIQRYVRGWLVRKREDVQEMRQFWKDIAGRNLFGKPDQLQETSDGTQEDPKLIRCKKYRLMFHKYETLEKRKHSDLWKMQQ